MLQDLQRRISVFLSLGLCFSLLVLLIMCECLSLFWLWLCFSLSLLLTYLYVCLSLSLCISLSLLLTLSVCLSLDCYCASPCYDCSSLDRVKQFFLHAFFRVYVPSALEWMSLYSAVSGQVWVGAWVGGGCVSVWVGAWVGGGCVGGRGGLHGQSRCSFRSLIKMVITIIISCDRSLI